MDNYKKKWKISPMWYNLIFFVIVFFIGVFTINTFEDTLWKYSLLFLIWFGILFMVLLRVFFIHWIISEIIPPLNDKIMKNKENYWIKRDNNFIEPSFSRDGEYTKNSKVKEKYVLYSFIFHIFVVSVGIFSLCNINSLENTLWEKTLIVLIWLALLYLASICLLFVSGFRS